MLLASWRDDTPFSAVPVALGSHLPILLLCFTGSILITLGFYKELGNLERMAGMSVEVEVGLGVKGPVKELEGIRARDERVGSGLERAKGDGVGKVPREMAVDVESPGSEIGDSQVGSATSESEPDERDGRQASEYVVVDWRTREQPGVDRVVDLHVGGVHGS